MTARTDLATSLCSHADHSIGSRRLLRTIERKRSTRVRPDRTRGGIRFRAASRDDDESDPESGGSRADASMDLRSEMPVPASRSASRLIVYSHDAFGLGNIRRTLKICDQLSKEIPDLSILLLTASAMVHSFRHSPKIDYIKLPCVHRQARNKYIAKFLRTSFREISQMREELIYASFKGFKPDIVLVDKVPVGIKGELLKSIEWLKANHPTSKVILGLRDILDDPEHVRKLWERSNFYDTLERLYDSIWVFGSAKIYDLVSEYGFPESIGRKLNYCGYIMQSPALRDKEEV